MDCLEITNDGKLCATDYKEIKKAILVVLSRGAKKVFQLVSAVREEYIEFRFLKEKNFILAIQELIKEKMIISKYR